MNEPTDTAIDTLILEHGVMGQAWPTQRQLHAFARAVHAKWGNPAPVGVEPVAWAFQHDDGTWHDPSLTEHSAGMKGLAPADQAIAMGRVPLTDEQLYLERRFAVSSLFHLIEQWTDKKIQSHQLADEAGKIVDHVIRRTEAAHGIKVGQHGTDN